MGKKNDVVVREITVGVLQDYTVAGGRLTKNQEENSIKLTFGEFHVVMDVTTAERVVAALQQAIIIVGGSGLGEETRTA